MIGQIDTSWILFGGAGLISLLAFLALILVPTVGSFGRTWEKVNAAIVSVFVLVALLAVGVALGGLIVYNWEEITGLFG